EKARKARRQAAAAAAGTTETAEAQSGSAAAVKTKADKGDTGSGSRTGSSARKGRSASGRATPRPGRHTPPVPKNVKTSPRWMGFVIIAMFLLGALVVILDYAGLLPGGVNNIWLIAAIAAIFVGLLLATRYH
ncbi:MAG: cell division protein CrgA, partial [Acidimicrobiales bacterium]|nr:cell division protein CrgA [Acidimicrobiales bacterium]